jgi:hypothetical protein
MYIQNPIPLPYIWCIEWFKDVIYTIVIPWPLWDLFVNYLINFQDSISTNDIFLNVLSICLVSFRKDTLNFLGENFNISENNIISVELA